MAPPTRSTRVTRPSADSTRDRIIAAAADLFSERSFEAATTRDIASLADVAQPLLNYHFRTKDALWREAVDSLFERLNHAMDERVVGLRGVDEVTSARLRVREFITFSARNPQLHRIILQESTAVGPRLDHLVEQIRPLYESTVEMFDHLTRTGAVAAIPATHLYYILVGAGPTIFALAPEFRLLTGLDPTADDVIEAHADAVCRLLFGT